MNTNRFLINTDFTTVHSNGSFIGRKHKVEIETTATVEELNTAEAREDLEKICVSLIKSEHPTWNIFMITVKDITPVQLSIT